MNQLVRKLQVENAALHAEVARRARIIQQILGHVREISEIGKEFSAEIPPIAVNGLIEEITKIVELAQSTTQDEFKPADIELMLTRPKAVL